MRIGLVSNDIGNTGSVLSALNFYNYEVVVIDSHMEINDVDVIVLSGVGSYRSSVRVFKQYGLWDKIAEAVAIKKKPILGICLGMQLFATIGYEEGINNGFGWIPGQVIRLEKSDVKVPHIGWANVQYNNETLFSGLINNDFYFMHSYHYVPDNQKHIIASLQLGTQKIVAGIRKGNIIGLQFHPEKSQGDGLRILRNVMEDFKCSIKG